MCNESATLSEILPHLWRKIYLGLLKEGFTEFQAFELLKTYVASLKFS
jgi:hypothetical protein